MGEFHDAVSTLLDAFGRGITIIKCQRSRRKKEQLPIEPMKRNAETHLSKSLKKNRTDVKNTYQRDLKHYGPGFAAGDAEAHSSLSAILFRLNAGFVSVIERFTKGRSSSTDYQALLNLSNASRVEAINTFEQLSHRISRSSLALVPSPSSKYRPHQRRRKHSGSTDPLRHSRSKSAPELSLTPLGPADRDGWVRPKPNRKSDSRSSRTSGHSTPHRSAPKSPASREPSMPYRRMDPQNNRIPADRPDRGGDRKSFMSFATDSTKLGEISEDKWAKLDAGKFSITTYYPLEPYQEPEKQKSKFMRFFKRGND